jgi:hypothetical protein
VIHLQEGVPDGERTVILVPVIVLEPGPVHAWGIRKPEAAPAQTVEVMNESGGIRGAVLQRLRERSPREEPREVGLL